MPSQCWLRRGLQSTQCNTASGSARMTRYPRGSAKMQGLHRLWASFSSASARRHFLKICFVKGGLIRQVIIKTFIRQVIT